MRPKQDAGIVPNQASLHFPNPCSWRHTGATDGLHEPLNLPQLSLKAQAEGLLRDAKVGKIELAKI